MHAEPVFLPSLTPDTQTRLLVCCLYLRSTGPKWTSPTVRPGWIVTWRSNRPQLSWQQQKQT